MGISTAPATFLDDCGVAAFQGEGEAGGGLPPLGPLVPIKKGSKGHALLKNWQRVPPKVLQVVMAKNPGCNVGLRLDMYLALDPDSKEAMAFLEKLEREGKLPATVAWRSASGRVTRLFLPPAGISVKPINSRGNVLSLELRTGKGNQCLIPPSEAESKQIPGKLIRYEWINDPRSTAVAALPLETLRIIQQLPNPKAAKGGRKPKPAKPAKPAQVKKDRPRLVSDSVPEGQRNPFLFRQGCSMRARGANQNEIEAKLQELNQARCAPPLDVGEVARIAGSVAKYPTGSSSTDLRFLRVTYAQVIAALEKLGGREEWIRRADLVKELQKITGCPGSIIIPPVSVPTIERCLKRMRSQRLISHRKGGWYKLPRKKRP